MQLQMQAADCRLQIGLQTQMSNDHGDFSGLLALMPRILVKSGLSPSKVVTNSKI